jgi:ribose transport system ATP-binding protein
MPNDIAIQIEKVTKEFPGVRALNDVTLAFHAGEVHALVGENGAGKSTLMKIISGVYSCDIGKVLLHGKETVFESPKHALDLGVSIIHQELSIVPDLTVAENIYLGREPRIGGFLMDRKSMNADAEQLLADIGVNIPPDQPAGKFTTAQKQMVEIAKATSQGASVVIMDEPTSSLSKKEVKALFEVIHKLKRENVAVIYISHRLAELFEICDKVTVLRDGSHIKTMPMQGTTETEIVSLMVGREIKDFFHKPEGSREEVVLKVDGLNKEGVFHDISFELHRGEILGFAGLVGARRTDVLQSVFGEKSYDSGSIYLRGERFEPRSPRDSIRRKVGFVTEDRRHTGLLLKHSVKDNMVLPSLTEHSRRGALDFNWEKAVSREFVEKLRIKTPTINTPSSSLSGGNQQKIIIAKWLIAQSDILFLDEPTRGIDVNAKAEIYALMCEFAMQGGSILMVSSEMPEILGVCTRVMVMRDGRITGELQAKDATEQKIISLAGFSASGVF